MFPYIHIGFLHIPTYTLCVLLGALAFTIVTIYLLEKKESVDKKITNRLLIISIFGFLALGGFALLFDSIFHSIKEGRMVVGGITWLGGVLGAFPTMIFLIHKFSPKTKGEALKYFNLLIPGIVLAHGFGRIGCFLGGCCYGIVTDSIFGVSFPGGSSAALQYPSADGGSLPVLPTQLYEAVFEFVLFFVMICCYKKTKEHYFEMYAFSYGVFRFALEFLRGDDRGSTGFFLSPSQIMSLILIGYGIVVLLYQKGKIFKKLKEKMSEYKRLREEEPKPVFGNDVLQTIRELKKLEEEGIITAEEFEASKQELLKKLTVAIQ